MLRILIIVILLFFATGLNAFKPHFFYDADSTQVVKCGLPHISNLYLEYQSDKPGSQEKLAAVLFRPEMQKSIVSPNGYYRIHYDTTGNDRVLYNIDEFAIAADSSYDFEVNKLGYPAPPTDFGAGGDNLYDIYILNLGFLYGETVPEVEIVPDEKRYTSFIRIDNDFAGFNTTGIEAAKVTIAHELHHAIQMGNYIYKPEETYFYELTSTAFEKFVYPYIYDYVYYIPSFFANTERSFVRQTGYNTAIWNLFLQSKYGYEIIKEQWQMMPQYHSIDCIDRSLKRRGTTLNETFREFGEWIFFTGYRTIPGKYFEDAEKFGTVTPFSSAQFMGNSLSIDFVTKPAALNFISIFRPDNGDSLTVLITNGDVFGAVANPLQNFRFKYNLFTFQNAGSRKLTGQYYDEFVRIDESSYEFAAFLNNTLVNRGNNSGKSETETPYPNPFKYSASFLGEIVFPVEINPGEEIELSVLSTSLDLIYSGTETVRLDGKSCVKWRAISSKGEKLNSGIYFYIIKSNSNTFSGKFTVIND
ncbi:MAG: hypothetical protein IAE91_10875 [Ignavibacteriaceae bacterium]|nr:hypothetical protein [Ignavibacteriaceae bacterium]